MENPFHSSIVYVDESGDHGGVSSEYPVFVLCFCIFEKASYAAQITTAIQQLKFRYFGHDVVVLHEREIRKAQAAFNFLLDPQIKASFMDDLNRLIVEAPFVLVAAAIRKDQLVESYSHPRDAYHLALEFGLERVSRHLGLTESSPIVHLVCESRGKKEDSDLELAFHRTCAGSNATRKKLPFKIVFAPKVGNYCGLEFADLIGRPIGRYVLDPLQANRAFDILKSKFRKNQSGSIDGYGLKIFPNSKTPR